MRIPTLAICFLSLLTLSGCESTRGHSARNEQIEQAYRDSLDPAKPRTLIGVSFQLPADRAWRVVSQEPYAYFAAGSELGANHTAGVAVSRQYPVATDFRVPADLALAVGRALRTLMPGEIEVIRSDVALSPELGPYCVKYVKHAKRLEPERPVPGGLIYQQHGYGCRHPYDASLFVDINYSELGPHERVAQDAVESRAKRFLARVKLVEPNLRGSGEYGIVGLELTKASASESVEVIAARLPYDAARQGIRAGDRLIEVDGADVTGLALKDVVKRLGGAPGTKTRIIVSRPGAKETLAFAVTRFPARWYVPW